MSRHKIGRNAPCPCGSGRKFKKCHIGVQGGSIPQGAIERVTEQFARLEREQQALTEIGIFVNPVKPVVYEGRKVWALGSRLYS